MTRPQLYQSYAREKIVSFFGALDEAQSLCNGQWLIFPKTVACLANVGEGPATSFFTTGSRFCWVADQPYHVNSNRGFHFVPTQVVGSAGTERTIHLFARSPDSPEFLYLGELGPAYAARQAGPQDHGIASFDLRSTLPTAVWLQLGGLRLGNLDFTPVDRALELLRGPTTVEDRLGVLQQLVEFWHGPIKPEDGMSDAELAGGPLPRPLRWWYHWAGRRTEIMSGWNTLFDPRDECCNYWQLTDEGHLFFYQEQQGVYQWSTLPHGDDPPVFGRYESTDPWEQEDITLSEHLILVCLFEALMCHARYGASAAYLDEEWVPEIASTIPPVAIAPWRWPPGGTRFFAGRGAFMSVCGNGEWDGVRCCSVSIGAKTEHPLQFLKPYIDDSWGNVAI